MAKADDSAKSAEARTILIVGGKDVGKSSLKKSLKKVFEKSVFLDTDEDGDDTDRNQFNILLRNAHVAVIAVGSYISKEDIWLTETVLNSNKSCCLVRPKANLVTDTWCQRLFDKTWENLEAQQRDIVLKVVRCTHEDDKERIRRDFACKDLPIFLLNGKNLTLGQYQPADYDAEKLIEFLKK